ncbi:MAG: histidine phosphatase family protein [Planctomycetes bacterium]|nr:histidine phosphatase family protein [Planctomycetota bacterium]MCB9934129.1 histidine phosphatase family protein [Planctomycetota bacterium]
MPTWWFVRHGESLAQINQWTGPDPDTPLSPLGEQQAHELAPQVAELPIQRVLVSPFLRARQTAERAMASWGQAQRGQAPLAVPDPFAPSASAPGKGSGTSASLRSQTPLSQTPLSQPPFLTVADLRERHSGDWLRFPQDEAIKRQLATWDFVPPGGESIQQAALRGLRALAELDGDHNTIIFAHGRILAGVLAVLDGADLGQPIHALPNCVALAREVTRGGWRELAERMG